MFRLRDNCRVSIPFKRERASQAIEIDDTLKVSLVSIPFKRERLSQEAQRRIRQREIQRFHSLQTGKTIASKPMMAEASKHHAAMFPFPSNGNAEHKQEKYGKELGGMKFPFPSNGNAEHKFGKHAIDKRNELFPFPSNGNAEHKFNPMLPDIETKGEFPFPSNGKAHRKCTLRLGRPEWSNILVSIPFKRERASQAQKQMPLV